MPNKNKIEILNEVLNSLNNLDKLVTIDGYNDLLFAKQQISILITVMNVEEKIYEDQIDE